MRTAAVIDHISQWLDHYCQQAGMVGFVVGVSGGIDSAVSSTLCARTGRPTLLLSMPIHQAPDQHDLSQQHCQWLLEHFPSVQTQTVDLSDAFDAFVTTLDNTAQQDKLALANSRSRLRMMTLYAHAGARRSLVAGTGNKVEDFGVGFYTKYGDGGVDLSPIADLMKTEVYALAAELGVVQGIQEAAPTDGLWDDGRTDEGQIEATYPELEWAMRYSENPSSSAQETLSARQQEVLAIYQGFHRANQHKMQAIPVCHIPEALRS